MAKRYFWLKLKEDFFQQKALKKLRSIAGGDTYTIIYLKLMLKALPEEGRLYFDRIEETFYEELALDIDEDPENVRITIAFLERRGLIELVDEDTLLIQYVKEATVSETSGAKRVREYRNRQKALQSNNGVTLLKQNVNVDIDIDIDIDKEKEGMSYPADKTTPAPAKKPKVIRHKYGEYANVLLSDEEMSKLKSEFPADWQERIERVSEYVATKGVSYKNFLAVVRSWAREDKKRGEIQRNLAGSQGGKGRQRYEFESDERRQELLDAWNDG